MLSFQSLGVPQDLINVLNSQGIKEPFAIQESVIKDALNGHDICGKAPTGSGKTLAFALPLVAGLPKASPGKPRALVLVPTRELAAQVTKTMEILAKSKGRSVLSVYGGTSFTPQYRALSRGVDIVVGCPGRLEDLVKRNALNLSDITTVVIDEADRMADMGFLPPVKRLLDKCPQQRNTYLFSATLDGEVDHLVKNYQNSPKVHSVESDEVLGEVTHHFLKIHRNEKTSFTADLADKLGSTIVFCKTKFGVDRVAQQLENRGIRTVTIHGNRTQRQREQALHSFSSGKSQILVATDVAARGVHIDNVACVIHFDPPADFKDYVHRSGRTGRAGNPGKVFCLIADEQLKSVKALKRSLPLTHGSNEEIVKADINNISYSKSTVQTQNETIPQSRRRDSWYKENRSTDRFDRDTRNGDGRKERTNDRFAKNGFGRRSNSANPQKPFERKGDGNSINRKSTGSVKTRSAKPKSSSGFESHSNRQSSKKFKASRKSW